VWSALGYALLREGDRAEARRALTRGLRLRPDDAAAWASLGEVLAVDGMPERSADALKLSVYFARQRPAALVHLRSSKLLAPQYRSVIRAQGRALDSLPQRSS
jgi:Flp pilus assembly protein TadD